MDLLDPLGLLELFGPSEPLEPLSPPELLYFLALSSSCRSSWGRCSHWSSLYHWIRWSLM
jgi:hypothetical protein